MGRDGDQEMNMDKGQVHEFIRSHAGKALQAMLSKEITQINNLQNLKEIIQIGCREDTLVHLKNIQGKIFDNLNYK